MCVELFSDKLIGRHNWPRKQNHDSSTFSQLPGHGDDTHTNVLKMMPPAHSTASHVPELPSGETIENPIRSDIIGQAGSIVKSQMSLLFCQVLSNAVSMV